MTSFTRTIPAYKTDKEVEAVLHRADHFVPLSFRPAQALSGDYIYLIYRGRIVGRARIAEVSPASSSNEAPAWAAWLIHYAGPWERPSREIPLTGHQGVRYLPAHGLEGLDRESWVA